MFTMKSKLLAILFCVALCGCSSVGSNLSKFVASLPPNSVTDASQTTTNPLYSHSESVTGMAKSPDGSIVITNLKANLTIPLWGFADTLSVTGLTISPAPAPAK